MIYILIDFNPICHSFGLSFELINQHCLVYLTDLCDREWYINGSRSTKIKLIVDRGVNLSQNNAKRWFGQISE
jgi:hypothetical protein